jgi:hypothetical protein
MYVQPRAEKIVSVWQSGVESAQKHLESCTARLKKAQCDKDELMKELYGLSDDENG